MEVNIKKKIYFKEIAWRNAQILSAERHDENKKDHLPWTIE